MRRPDTQMRSLDTLLDTLPLGQELDQLLTASAQSKTTISNYPAISPLLALRTSLNSVLEIARFEGSLPRFSDDGQWLVTNSGSDNTSRLYDLSGQLMATFESGFPRFSDDGQRLVTTVSDDDISGVYDIADNLLAEFPGTAYSPAQQLGFTDDSNYLFTRTKDGFYHLWPLDDGLDDLLARGCDWVRP